jgi:rare lipoprotein A
MKKSSKKSTAPILTKSLKRRSGTFMAKQIIKPHALMGCVLLGLAACSGGGGSDGGNRTSVNKHKYHHGRSSVSSGDYSPYGGTSHPTQVKVGKAYDVNGTTYYPRHDPQYSETGQASWYGPRFHGRMTASGERYDQHEMTAAHRTLPLPSMVRVTRLDSGESTVVRVNDRGPFAHGRIIDLSKAAASELDMMRDGVARVKVEYLPAETRQYIAEMGLEEPDFMKGDVNDIKLASAMPASVVKHTFPTTHAAKAKVTPFQVGQSSYQTGSIKASAVESFTPVRAASSAAPVKTPATNTFKVAVVPTAPAKLSNTFSVASVKPALPAAITPTGQNFNVQTAAFSDRINAERHVEELSSVGHASIMPVSVNSGTFYRVMLGPVQQYQQAASLLKQTKELGYKDARIMVE